MNKIERFVHRMKKLNIDVELTGNMPWVYIHKVNGNVVKEQYQSSHGFTAFFLLDKPKVTSIKRIFEIIKKYK